ncbi:AAA ATPase midasin, partial [Spiromyces aspiralis]
MIDCGNATARELSDFSLQAPTTFDNLVRLLRGMQIPKPILLEGSPGVGKTSLVSALANLSGHHLVRINLSDQTDLMDLFGSDLPVEGGKPGEFVWRDAPFLQAMQSGHWVLLDEINLASQSVLEGLNACLDHRGTVYVSELDKSFSQHPGFRVFAAQNPIQQGGGRKGLPKSFVNRFTQVYFDELNRDDMMMICQNLFAASFGRASDDPSSAARDDVARRILGQVLAFNDEVYRETMVTRRFGREGSPWEFNLRDVLRWLEISVSRTPSMQFDAAVRYFVRMLYVDRMRNPADRQHVADLYHRVFGDAIADLVKGNPHYTITPARIQVGGAVLDRRAVAQRPLTGGVSSLRLLRHQLRPLESAMHCLSMSWMPILIGKSGVGKTSLVRWLAATAGYPLVEFSMNTGVDTMELLGGFEQVDLFRHFEHVRQRIYALIKRIEQEVLASRSGPAQQSKLAELGQLLMRLHADNTVTRSRSGSEGGDGGHPDFKAARLALEDICRFATDNGPLAAIDGSGGSIVAEAEAIDRHLEVCRDMAARGVSGQFEWVDGVLVEALEKGHWLLVDQANLCNPSVLDRLNGLLEPRGVLVVNERGMVDGQIKIISPHPDFRIIMTMDPSAGELSRAMRNRGIEIVMHEPTLDDGEVLDWILDVASANGIHDMPLAANLLRVIDKQTRLESHIGDSRAVSCSLTRDYSLLCRLVAEKVQRGVQLSHDLLLSTPIDGKARSGSDDRVMQEFYGWLNRLPSFSQINSCTLQESLLTTLLAEFAGAASGSGDDRAAARLLAAVALATRYTLDDGGDDDDDDAGSSGPWWVKSFRAQVGHLRSMLHGSLAAAARGSSSGCANEKIDKVVEFITEPHPLIEAAVSLVKKQLRGNEVPLVTIPVDVGKVSETSLASNISRTLSAWFISYHCAESLDEARELGHLTDAPGSGSAAQVQGLTHLQLAYLYTASHGQQVLSTQLNHPVLTVVYPLLEATRDLAYRWVDYLAGEATSDASPSMRDEGIYHRLTTTVETVMSIRRQMWDKLAAVRGIRSPVNISYLSACGEWMRDALDNVTDIAGVLSDDVGTALGNVTGHLQAFQAALDQGNGTQVARIIWERNHPITLLDSELRKLEVKLTTQAARLATAAAGDDEESSEWVVQGLATIYALADKSAREHRGDLLATLGQVAERLEDKLAPVSKAGPDAAGGDSGENNTEGAPAAVTPSAFLGRLLVLARQHSNNRMLDIIASGLSLSQAADSTELAGAAALTAFKLMRPILARLSTAHVSGYDWDR